MNRYGGSNQRLPVDGDEDDFRQLLETARRGCPQALGQLAEMCRPYLLLVANEDLDPGLRGRVAASDVVQETLIAVQKDIAQFRGNGPSDFVAWVRGILINDLLETRRKHRGAARRNVDREVPLAGDSRIGRRPIEISSPDVSPSSEAVAKEEAAALAWAMSQLPEHYREVIQLRNWEEMSFEAIGRQIGRSTDGSRKLWSRAVLRLQQLLEQRTFGPLGGGDEP